MKKVLILLAVFVVGVLAQDRLYTKARAGNYAVTSGWTWKRLDTVSLAPVRLNILFTGLGADSLHVAFHRVSSDTALGNRLSFGVRDSATWIELPPMFIDSIGVRTKATTSNVFFQYRMFK